jgi:hypothetical protein
MGAWRSENLSPFPTTSLGITNLAGRSADLWIVKQSLLLKPGVLTFPEKS